jgi:hypothetical protein
MKLNRYFSCALCALAVAACGKKDKTTPDKITTPPPVVATAASAVLAAPEPPKELSDQERERQHKQARLDFAVRENDFLNDPRGQWAQSASASSTFGEGEGKQPSSSSLASNMKSKPDGATWSNNQQDMGFDHAQLIYEKPVFATDVRVVFTSAHAVESVSKVELQDVDGKWSTVWSGVSDVKPDQEGLRTWFVRSFPKTAYKVKAVQVTFANNVSRGYKEIDAVQLVGD